MDSRPFRSAFLIAAAMLIAPPAAQAQVGSCDHYTVDRQPFFGDTHVHTTFSFDAWGIEHDPRAAYTHAQGGTIVLPGGISNPDATHTVTMDEPLDFAIVTDHAEGLAANWGQTQSAAEEFYDRSSACAFTTFPAWEFSSNPNGENLHRNVIFRNEFVPAAPFSANDGTVNDLWAALQAECLDAGNGCDVLTIPHNSNLSNGSMFADPLDDQEAATRARFEPLVEVYQHKGDSECRFDLRFGSGVLTNDELCSFEKETRLKLPVQDFGPPLPHPTAFPARAWVRNALKAGLAIERDLGVNPFRYGLLASTDTHNATPGYTEEAEYAGHSGVLEGSVTEPTFNRIALPWGSAGSGGLAVVWAEENSRDALFDAMRRREVYGTSGNRPIVRMFAGDIPGKFCRTAAFADLGYVRGVPMGGEIGAVKGRSSPRIAVLATKDAASGANWGTDLQRIQIVKGWIDAAGETHEEVFDVAGDPDNGAGVDAATCMPLVAGFAELCAVWRDPTFDVTQPAFYYARVIENPTCRWSTIQCKVGGVDPFADEATCLAQTAATGVGVSSHPSACCLNEGTDPPIERTVQERAWTSPIWYRPDGIGKFKGTLSLDGGGNDELSIVARIADLPDDVDPSSQAFQLVVRDDDLIYSAALPPGSFSALPGQYTYFDPTGSVDGVEIARITIDGNGGAKLYLRTGPVDLSNADPESHHVAVELTIGDYEASHRRKWVFKSGRLLGR
jgi:hypothetical protein